MESSGHCLQYFIGMGNLKKIPRNCQWKLAILRKLCSKKCSFLRMGLPSLWVVGCQSLEIGNFEKIVFEKM
jgi:hypothetical protein